MDRLGAELTLKVREMKTGDLRAWRSKLPERREMQDLRRKIVSIDRELVRELSVISKIQPTTVEGALAKIELGLRQQGPWGWQDNAKVLLQEGIEGLRAFI